MSPAHAIVISVGVLVILLAVILIVRAEREGRQLEPRRRLPRAERPRRSERKPGGDRRI